MSTIAILSLAAGVTSCVPKIVGAPLGGGTGTDTGTTSAGTSTPLSTISGTGPVIANGVAFSTITITLLDSSGNFIVGTTPTFTATDTGNTNFGYSTCSPSTVAGVSTCFLYSTKAEAKTLSILTPVSGVSSTSPVIFTNGPAARLTWSRQPTGAQAGSPLTIAPALTLTDINGNTVTTGPDATATLSLSVASGTGALFGTSSISFSAGVADFSSYGVNFHAVGTKTLSATKASTVGLGGTAALTVGTASSSFVITAGAVALAQSTIVAVPATGIAADGISTSTITVTLNDQYSNPVSGQTVTLSATGSNNTLTGPVAATNASGQTTATLASTTAEVKTVTVTAPPLAAGLSTTVTFVVSTVSAAQSSITVTAGPTIANGVATGTVTIVLKTAGGAAVPGITPTFAGTGSSNIYGVCSATNGAGASNCTIASTVAQVENVVLLTPVSLTSLGTITFVAGPAALIVFTTQPSNGIANLALPTQPIVQIEDAQGNLITSGADATAPITLSVASGGGTVNGTQTVTASGGIAPFTGDGVAISTGGTKTLNAQKADETGGGGVGVLNGTSASFVVLGNNPPVISSIVASDTNSPSSPPTSAQLSSAGGQVYVQWQAAAGSGETLGTTPIGLYYTTDGSTYTQISASLLNASNGACTLTGSETGCYVWSSAPTSGYLGIRMIMTDSNGLSASQTAPALNVGTSITLIAGTTDSGFKASGASSAYTQFTQAPGNLVVTNAGTVYITDKYRGILKIDGVTGTMTQLLKPGGSACAAGQVGCNGDGGLAQDANQNAIASVYLPYKLTLDNLDRLLIFDNTRIRRYDPSTGIVDTLIGGGTAASDPVCTTGPGGCNVTPTSVVLQNMPTSNQGLTLSENGWAWSMTFMGLPNGDILFSSDYPEHTPNNATHPFRVRIYRNNNGAPYVTTLPIPNGTGYEGNGVTNLATCALFNFVAGFNPTTYTGATPNLTDALALVDTYGTVNGAVGCNITGGLPVPFVRMDPVLLSSTGQTHPNALDSNGWTNYESGYKFTGRDGNIYALDTYNSAGVSMGVFRNDSLTNWTRLLGNGTAGVCADGTSATGAGCNLQLTDAFVSSSGQLYFTDAGKIRTVDANGNVQTIYGQGFTFGDGGLAVNARMGLAQQFDFFNSSGTLYVAFVDQFTSLLRRFVVGSTITTIAGNGNSGSMNFAVAATSTTLNRLTTYGNFKLEKNTGDLYGALNWNTDLTLLSFNSGNPVGVKWQHINTAQTVDYSVADGSNWNTIIMDHPAQFVGASGDELVVFNSSGPDGAPTNPMIKLFNATVGTQSSLLGYVGSASNANAFPSTTSTYNPGNRFANSSLTNWYWDSTNSVWVFTDATATAGGANLYYANTVSTVVDKLVDTGGATVLSYAWIPGSAGHNTMYYCAGSGANQGKLVEVSNITFGTPASGTSTALSYGVPGITCTGNAMYYFPASVRPGNGNGTIMFLYFQNGFEGIAEYNI